MSAAFDPSFGTAREALAAMHDRTISSHELVAHVFDRIRTHNPRLNLFVTLAEDAAMAAATAADERRATGGPLGALHGLPIVVKDVFATAGIRTTSGSTALANHVPTENAAAVARLVAAGAVIVGKTNMPEFAGDWQAYNDVAGTSNNPWDVTRTPGGSTGGAAAMAAGLGFLELGGDLAGSVRIPSHFCGVYGHRPSVGVIPTRGHIPPMPGQPHVPNDLSAVGPVARSADDLRLLLEALGGAEPPESLAFHWHLAAPRHTRLADYRIGYVLDDPFCPVDAPVKAAMTNAIDALRRAGATVVEGWPEGVDPSAQYATCGRLIAAFLSITMPDPAFDAMRQHVARGGGDPWSLGVTMTHREWLQTSAVRLQMRAAWQAWFATHDAFLMPTAIVPAFPHDHSPMPTRQLPTTTAPRRYTDISAWTSFGTLTGFPVTAAPIGLTNDGLPVGMQIMGPAFEDATPIDLAMRMADVVGGCIVPPSVQS